MADQTLEGVTKNRQKPVFCLSAIYSRRRINLPEIAQGGPAQAHATH